MGSDESDKREESERVDGTRDLRSLYWRRHERIRQREVATQTCKCMKEERARELALLGADVERGARWWNRESQLAPGGQALLLWDLQSEVIATWKEEKEKERKKARKEASTDE